MATDADRPSSGGSAPDEHGTGSPGLGARAARGVLSTGTAQVGAVALQLVSVVVLARLISPRDYGLMAMAMTVIGLGHMFRDFGLFSSAVRAPVLTVGQRDNLFWLNVGVGAVLGVACLVSGPLLARAYGYDELAHIAAALAPTFLVSGATMQYRVSLVRDLRFGTVAALDLGSSVAGVAVAMVAAWAGAGYWALVLQQLTGVSTLLLATVAVARWRPRRPRRHTDVRPLVRMGGSVMVSGLLTYVANTVDTVMVGGRFGATSAGLYNRSVQLTRTTLRQLEGPIGSVSLPVMARLQHDDDRMLEFGRRVQASLNYPVLLVVALVVAVPVDVVRIALGESWLDAAPIVAWIAVGTGFGVAADIAGTLLLAKGAGGMLTRVSLVTAMLTVLGVFVGATMGVREVAAGVAIAAMLGLPVSLFAVRRGTGLRVTVLAVGVVRVVALAVCGSLMARVAVAWVGESSVVRVATAALTIGLVVLVAVAFFGPVRRDIQELLQTVRLALPQRRKGLG